MAKQQLHGFGAFFFLVGVALLLGALVVTVSAEKDMQILAVAGAVCFVAAALTLRPPRDAERTTGADPTGANWPAAAGNRGGDQVTAKPRGNS